MGKKVAIVTGASSGIGRATALLLLEKDYDVVAVGRNSKELNALRDEAQSLKGAIKLSLADIREVSQVDRLISDSFENNGRIDLLVNAAGVILNGSIETTSLDDWDKMFNINLRAVFYLMQKCMPHLEKSRGCVVNVSSITGLRAFPNVLAYCVSKAAVDQLTRCSALEMAAKGVRVNAVNPGVVVTNLHKRGGMADADYETFIKNAKKTHPLGRAGTPREVAELICFLASDDASWITGVTYEIDGGRGQTCAR